MRNVQKETVVSYTLTLDETEVRLVFEGLTLLLDADERDLWSAPRELDRSVIHQLVGGLVADWPPVMKARAYTLRDLPSPVDPTQPQTAPFVEALDLRLLRYFKRQALTIYQVIAQSDCGEHAAYRSVRVLAAAGLLLNTTPEKSRNQVYSITPLGREWLQRERDQNQEEKRKSAAGGSAPYREGVFAGYYPQSNATCDLCQKRARAYEARALWPATDICDTCAEKTEVEVHTPDTAASLPGETPPSERRAGIEIPGSPQAFLEWLWARGATFQKIDGEWGLVGPDPVIRADWIRDEAAKRFPELRPLLESWSVRHRYASTKDEVAPNHSPPLAESIETNGKAKKSFDPTMTTDNNWREKKATQSRRRS